MKLSLILVAALATLSGCAASATDESVGASAESDLTKASVKVLGEMTVGTPEYGGYQSAESASASYQGYKFAITAGSAVDIAVGGGSKLEAVVMDATRKVIATSTLVDEEAVIRNVTFDKDGVYVIAFRDTGDLSALKRGPSVSLNRNYDKAPITHIACKTKEKIDGAIETFDIDVAYMNDPKIEWQILNVPGSDPDDVPVFIGTKEGAYGGSLNENFGAVMQDGKFVVSGDADGFFLVELVLYENSDLKKGFFRVYNNMNGSDMYSEVSCTVKEAVGR